MAPLVRGNDSHGHFLPVPRPSADLAPAAIAAWQRISDEQSAYYFEGGEANWSGGTNTKLR